MIKAVFYDLGDIFFESHYWRKWMYERFIEGEFYKGSFADFYHFYDKYLTATYIEDKTYEKTYREFLELLKISNPDKFIKQSFEKKREYEVNRKLFKSVQETLLNIQEQQIKNVILSDNEYTGSELREKVLERYELNPLIDFVITSKDAGYCKPSPEIFNYALNKTGFKKEEIIFVAHDKDEIDGAKKIGIFTLEFNNYLGMETNHDIRIDNFSELLAVITNYNRGLVERV